MFNDPDRDTGAEKSETHQELPFSMSLSKEKGMKAAPKPLPQRVTLSAAKRKQVANATITITKTGGQGVLVPGNLLLTAAHCIEFECTGSMTLGEYFIEPIDTWRGQLNVGPLAVEPVSDLAVLGSLDDQAFSDDAEKFELFCEQTTSVPVCVKAFEVFKKFPVFIYYRKEDRWIVATAAQCRKDAERLWIEADDEPIVGGMSGGPIVNQSGELVAIVSASSEGESVCTGLSPRPHLTVPVWISRRIIR